MDSESRLAGRGGCVDSFQLGAVTCRIKVGDRLRARRTEEGESWRLSRQGTGRMCGEVVARECGRKTDVKS